MPLCITIVHADGDQMRVIVVHAEQNGEHSRIRHQIARGGTVEPDTPET